MGKTLFLILAVLSAGGLGCQGTSQTDVAPPVTKAEPNPLLDPRHQTFQENAPGRFQVQVETTKGVFIIDVHRSWAPLGADRFYNLVRHGYYDDTRFYRVVEGSWVQFGINGDPEIATLWRRERFPDDPVTQSNLRGFTSYAMAGHDDRTTQVFINLGDNERLDEGGFAPFGRVVEGMDVVDSLYSGYGENSGGGIRRGNQAPIFEEGNAYLDREFPKLDRLVSAKVVDIDSGR